MIFSFEPQNDSLFCFTYLQSEIRRPSDVKCDDEPERLLEYLDRKPAPTVCVHRSAFLIFIDMVRQISHDARCCNDCKNDGDL